MDLVIFDLDGTLIDSKLDLIHAVNATRSQMGLAPLDEELISSYVGNGAPVLIRRALGPHASESDVQKGLEFFLAYYREHMLDYTRMYPGVRESLERLAGDGIRMAILTNKPYRFSQAIVDGLGVGNHFFRLFGGNSFDQKKPHPVGIQTLLAECELEPDRALMVGDSAVDVKTARNAGVAACGVSYGFQPETFRDEPPDFVVDRMEEMVEWVAKRRKQNAGAV